MRMPRMRSLLTGSGTPWMPQSSAARLAFARHEQQVPVDRHVALRRRAEIRQRQRRLRRVRDVEDLEAVVVALDGVLAGEREIGVGHAEELRIGGVVETRRMFQAACAASHRPGPDRRADRGSAPSPTRSASPAPGMTAGGGRWRRRRAAATAPASPGRPAQNRLPAARPRVRLGSEAAPQWQPLESALAALAAAKLAVSPLSRPAGSTRPAPPAAAPDAGVDFGAQPTTISPTAIDTTASNLTVGTPFRPINYGFSPRMTRTTRIGFMIWLRM